MNRRFWLVVGAVWFCAAPRAPGDTLKGGQPTHSSAAAARQSFRPLGDKIDPSTVDEILSARLRDVMEQGKLHDVQQLFGDKVLLRKLTRDKLSPDQLKFLDANSDKIGELLKDPRFLSLLGDFKDARKGGAVLSESQIDALRKLADSRLDPSALPADDGSGSSASGTSAGKILRSTPGVAGPDTGQQLPKPDPADSEENGSWLDRQINLLSAPIMDRLNDPANGAAFEEALRELKVLKPGEDGSESVDVNGLWKSATDDAATWVSSRWEWPGKMADASASLLRDVRVVLPEVEASVVGGIAKLPAGPSAPSGNGGVEALEVTVAVIALAALAWQLYEQRRRVRGLGDDLLPAEWPVEPAAVATPMDLIQAFEYLAVLRVGPEARTRNHLAIALRLGEAAGADDSRRAAARELAGLYERARYAPDPPEFGEADLAAARRDLTLLARIGGA